MKPKLTKTLSLVLAAILQLTPVLRSILPTAGSNTSALVFRWLAGSIAFLGYDAISGATTLSTPPPATVNVPYAATISYNGSHSGQVSSMAVSNNCLGSYQIAPGLNITYSGSYNATISGTPTGQIGTFPLTIRIFDASGCGSGESDTRSTSLVIQNSSGTATPPVITVAPQSAISLVGSDVVLSGLATGNPTPSYFWKQGLTFIPGATNNNLTITAAQLTSAGLYTLVASNSQNTANAICYLTMAKSPSSLQYLFTNYVVAGTPVTMVSLMTNSPSGVYSYAWQYNFNNIGVTTPNLSLTAAQTVPSKSGTYSVNFNSSIGSTIVVSNQLYDSYWQFGYVPVITNGPVDVSVPSGSNATFNLTLAGSSYPVLLLYKNATNLVATQTNLYYTYNPTSLSATTNVSLTLSNISAADAGSYTVVVTNFWGSTTSSPAMLSVATSLSVSAPLGETNYAGKNISLNVTANGTGPFSYQWQKGASNLVNGGVISGVNTNTLVIAPAAPVNSGNYQVIVTNNSGSVTSGVATVSIVPVPQFALSLGATNATLSATGGVVGSNYVIQVSTNVADSLSWVSIKTNTVSANGAISFTDTNPAASGQHYYRVRFP